MATAKAGFNGTIRVSNNGGSSYSVLGGVVEASFEDIMAELDSTTFGDTNQRRIYGLGDVNSSVSFIWAPADAGQVLVRNAKAARTNITLEYLPDGVAGFRAEFICTSISTSQSVDDRVDGAYEFALADGSVVYV